jgi:hypothetical protein
LEAGIGRDLGDVRLHVGSEAAASADAVDARAYSFGADIVFGAGQYRPDTADGIGLLAHEVAHVAQQSGPGAACAAPRARAPALMRQRRRPPRMLQIVLNGSQATVRGYRPDWSAIRGRVLAEFPEIGLYLGPFTAADLAGAASRRVTRIFRTDAASEPREISEIALRIVADTSALRNDQGTAAPPAAATRRGTVVHSFQVEVNSFFAIADVFPGLTMRRIAALNADPAEIQHAMDERLAEVLAHEFLHVLIRDPTLDPARAPSGLSGEYRRLLAAATGSPAAQSAFQQVERTAAALIRQAAAPLPDHETVVARVVAAHSGPPMLEWFINELFVNQRTRAAFGRAVSAAHIAELYADARIDLMIRHIATVHRQPVQRPPDSDIAWETLQRAFRNHVADLFAAVLATLPSAASPQQAATPPAAAGAATGAPAPSPRSR